MKKAIIAIGVAGLLASAPDEVSPSSFGSGLGEESGSGRLSASVRDAASVSDRGATSAWD